MSERTAAVLIRDLPESDALAAYMAMTMKSIALCLLSTVGGLLVSYGYRVSSITAG